MNDMMNTIKAQLEEKGYDHAVAIATEAEIKAGAACGQLSLLTENQKKKKKKKSVLNVTSEGVMFWYGMVNNGKNMVPVVTVASRYNPEDGTVSRGIAICSKEDNPIREEGRKLALKRLAIAEHRQIDSMPVYWNGDAVKASGANTTEFTHWKMKSQYHAPIEEREKKVFLGPKSKHVK